MFCCLILFFVPNYTWCPSDVAVTIKTKLKSLFQNIYQYIRRQYNNNRNTSVPSFDSDLPLRSDTTFDEESRSYKMKDTQQQIVDIPSSSSSSSSNNNSNNRNNTMNNYNNQNNNNTNIKSENMNTTSNTINAYHTTNNNTNNMNHYSAYNNNTDIIPTSFDYRPPPADKFILTWIALQMINWDIIFLLGGGFALSKGFQESGLSRIITERVRMASGANFNALVVGSCVLACFITNFMSNIAVANILLPALACIGPTHGNKSPLYFLTPVTLSISLALLSPIGSPPNAIIMASGNVTMKHFFQIGGLLSIIFLTTTIMYSIYLVPLFLENDTSADSPAVKSVCGT